MTDFIFYLPRDFDPIICIYKQTMNWKEFRQNVKNAKLPYYLSDDPDHVDNLDCESPPSKYMSPISLKGFFLHFLTDNISEGFRTTNLSFSRNNSPKSTRNFQHRLGSKRTFYSHLGNIVEEFFDNVRGRQAKTNLRIKYASLERVALDELHLFYRFNHSTKRIKKMCDFNLWCVINELKTIYHNESDSSKHTLILDIGRLILHFIFSSISQLRFEQCRNILERLAKLENIFFGSLTGKSEPKSRSSLNSQMQTSGLYESAIFRKTSTVNSALGTPFSSKSEIGQSIDTITHKLFNNGILSSTPKARINISEALKQSEAYHKKNEIASNKGIFNLIAQVKYTIAQMGHFLHYDELSNRTTEMFSKGYQDDKRGKISRKPSTGKTITPTNAPRSDNTHRGTKEGSRQYLNFTAAVSEHSIADPPEKDRFMERDLFFTNVASSKHLKDYFYLTKNFLDDYAEDAIMARTEQLAKYCKWKTKKWLVNHKREKFEQKYEQYKIVCKICAQKVHVDKMKDHSGLCRKRAEITKDIKVIDNRISDTVFKAVLRSKELHTKLVLHRLQSKKHTKLQQQSSYETNPPTPGFPRSNHSVYNFGIPDAQSDSTFSTVDTPVYAMRKQHTENLSAYVNKNKPQAPNFALHINKLEPEKQVLSRKGSLTDRLQQCESGEVAQETSDHSKSDLRSARARKLTEDESSKSRESEPNSYKTATKNPKAPTFLPLQSPGRRHSESRITFFPKDDDDKKQAFRKRNNVYHIDPQALEQILISIDYKEDPHKSKGEYSSQSVQVHSPESSPSMTASSSSMCTSEDEENGNDDSPFSSKRQKSPMPQYLKSKFFNLNKSKTANIEENEENKSEFVRKSDRFITYQGAQAKLSEEETKEMKDSSDEGVTYNLRVKETRKKSSFFRNEDLSPTLSAESRMDPRLVEKIRKVKQEMNQTKTIISLYEVIRDKGKGIINQPPYLKTLEITKTDTIEEVNTLKIKIDNKDALEFSDQFLSLLNERILKGRKFRDTKRELNKLEGIIEQEQDIKTGFDRRPSLMKGTFVSPKSMSQLQRASLRLKDAKTKPPFLTNLQTKDNREIQPVITLNPILFTRSQDPTKAEKTMKFMGLRLQGVRNSDDDSPLNSQTLSPARNTAAKNKPQNDGSDPNRALTSLNTVKSFNDSEGSISENEEDDESDTATEKRDYNHGDLSRVSEEVANTSQVSPARFWVSEHEKLSGFYHNKEPTSIVLEGVPKEDHYNKPSILLPSDPSIILHEDLKMGSKDASSNSIELEESDKEEMNKIPSIDLNYNKASEEEIQKMKTSGIVEKKDSSSKELQSPPSRAAKMKGFHKQKTMESIPSFAQFCTAQQAVVTKAFAGDLRTLTGILDLEYQKRLRNRAHTSEQPADGQNTPSNTQKLIIIQDTKTSNKINEKNTFLPSLKVTSNVFMEDFFLDNENQQDAPESLFLVDTVLERGYHSDSQVKQIRIPVKIQPLIGMNDFEPLKMISRGAFGRVWLVKRKATNDLYAMKVIDLTEKFLKNNKELENLRKENKVFGLAQEDFVVRAVFTFTFQTCICFVMEYMIGGDFGDILYNYCALEEDVARFYLAEIVLAVEYLHSLGIAHRDLKPDNILLDKNGHAKLTDFGLSETGLSQKMKTGHAYVEANAYQGKIQEINQLCANMNTLGNQINLMLNGKIMEKRHESAEKVDEIIEATSKDSLPSPRDSSPKKRNSKRHPRLIGTPDYMAPEIILGASVTSYSIDWWSLGVILFEFLVGVPPFNDSSPDKIYDNIVNLRIPWNELSIGYEENCISPEAADLINKLLTLDHKKRLGTNGVAEIKSHKFFEGINWETLRRQKPPIVPEHKNETDTTNFVRLAETISDKEREDFTKFWPKDDKATSKLADVKQYLKGAFESMFNVAALDSDNMKLAEETLKEREEELKAFRDQIIHEAEGNNLFYDDVFDHPDE